MKYVVTPDTAWGTSWFAARTLRSFVFTIRSGMKLLTWWSRAKGLAARGQCVESMLWAARKQSHYILSSNDEEIPLLLNIWLQL